MNCRLIVGEILNKLPISLRKFFDEGYFGKIESREDGWTDECMMD